jgi:hypothetical protein
MLHALTILLLGVSVATTDGTATDVAATDVATAETSATDDATAEIAVGDSEVADSEVADSGVAEPETKMSEALQIANEAYETIVNEIQDYTCQITKRERVNGYLFGYQTMFLKIRHPRMEGERVVTPLSIYIKFHSPARLKGREVIYVAGKNDGKLIVRKGGDRLKFVTTSVAPDSPAAMQENRYPTTEVGVMNLTARLIEAGKGKLHCPNCDTTIAKGAKINGRLCTLIQVSNVVRREGQTFKTARIFVDDQLKLPVRFSSYDWPREDGGELVLLEEYTYTDIKLNVGLTDWDFDHRNENYKFMKGFRP